LPVRFRARRILLADRDREFLSATTRLLEVMGFHVIQAESGTQVSSILDSDLRLNLVILDPDLPEAEVLGTLEDILLYSDRRNIPFVILSDYVRAKEDKGYDSALIHYLKKPLNAEILHGALQMLLFARYGQTRKHIRAEIDSVVGVSFPGFTRSLKASSISEGGIYLLMDTPLPVGTELSVCMEVKEKSDITVDGRVIYASTAVGSTSDISPGLAVQFTRVTDDVASSLSGLVRTMLTV